MTKTGFKPISAFLRENESVKPIQDRFAATSRLQQSVADALPAGLKTACRVVTMQGSTLVIAAANGAVAAKLKQMLPRLLELFREQFHENKTQEQEVTAISVLVQPDYFAFPREPDTRPPKVAIPTKTLAELAEALPDSPLRQAVERIRQKRERALTSGKKGNQNMKL